MKGADVRAIFYSRETACCCCIVVVVDYVNPLYLTTMICYLQLNLMYHDGDVLYPSIRLFNENPASRISWQVCQCLQGRKGRQGRKGGTFNDLLLHAILLHLFDFFADRSN